MRQVQAFSRLLGILMAAGLLVAACSPAATALAPTSAPTAVPATATAASFPESSPTAASGEAVPAISVKLGYPSDIAFDADGNLFLSQCTLSGAKVFKINPAGQSIVYASPFGGGRFGGDGGPALSADIYCPMGLAFDRDGNLFVADWGNDRVRRIDQAGIITTVAGSGPPDQPGFAGDGGPATAAVLGHPTDIAFDADGNLYILEAPDFRIRKVDRQGIITTFAGTGEAGFAGDGGLATAAQFNLGGEGLSKGVAGIAFDAQGNLYVADTGNARVRKIDRQGIITTIAGTGESGFSGDGQPATAAELVSPYMLAFDAAGNLYISDGPSPSVFECRVRKIDNDGIITTVIGRGYQEFAGDGGPATAALINFPWGMAFDSQGNLYLADAGNNRVRRVDNDGIITTVVGGGP